MHAGTLKDAPFMQSILDLPGIERGLRGGYPGLFPSAKMLLDLGKVAVFEDGFFAFIRVADKAYEVHTCFVPNGDFFAKVRKAREALRWIFTTTWADEVQTQIHAHNRVALHLARRGGFVPMGATDIRSWHRLSLIDWMLRDAALVEPGTALRERLGLPVNPVVSSILGFVTCLSPGMEPKGAELMSRYAILLGIPSLRVESWSPFSLSWNGTVVEVKGAIPCP